ncbi:MAG: putative ABC transporter permease [Lachnospiraceae bacterium]|nr:putative ABC transporter permease [Lachnospiraceae bacterium]
MFELALFGIDFFKVFYCFFIYCFVGWIWECCYCSVVEGKLINRGFLNGPIIPIYGCAATGMLLVFFNPGMRELSAESSVKSYICIFLLGALVASVFEYFTSWIMELLFHAKWWDYSHVPLNIKGRICLPVAAFWGIMAIGLVKFLHPAVMNLIDKFSRKLFEPAGYVIFVIFLVDIVSTIVATVQLDQKITAITRIKEELNDFAQGLREAEVNTKNEFKRRYGETPIGDVIEHVLDRIDASIAFTMQGYGQRKEEFDKKVDGKIEAIDKVLAANKIRIDKAASTGKSKYEELKDDLRQGFGKIASGFKGYIKFTAKRLSLAFPTLKLKGEREETVKVLKDELGYKDNVNVIDRIKQRKNKGNE